MTLIDWIFLSFYFIILVYVTYRGTKKVKTSSDFSIAGSKIIWPILFATLSASFLGGGSSIGRASQTFRDGYVFLLASMSFPLQTILVGLFVAPKLKSYKNACTVGDVMEQHYGKLVRAFTGILSVLVCAGILGAQALAIGSISNVILGFDTATSIIIGMGIILIYSTIGGMWTVIQTDTIQFVLLGVFIPIVMFIGLDKVGGASSLLNQLPSHFVGFGNYSIFTFMTFFLGYFLGETLVPPYTQRAFSAPDAENAKKGYIVSGFFGILFYIITATCGLIAYVIYPNIQSGDALVTLIRDTLPIGITGLVLSALLAVIMSTADSYLNSTSVVFTHDIYLPFINPNATDKQKLFVSRITNLVIGAIATIFAISLNDIIQVLLMSYALWAPTIIIPFVLAVVFKHNNEKAAIWAIVSGALVTILWKWGPYDLKGLTGGVTHLIAGILTNIIVYILVGYFTGGFTKDRRS